MRLALNIAVLALLPTIGLSQFSAYSYRFFQPLSASGAIKVGGNYRNLKGQSNDIYNFQKSSLLYAGIAVNTNCYVLHPNFFLLDLGLEYNPEKGQDLFLVVPDQSEVRTLKKLNLNGTFFRQKNINIGVFANFNQLFNNRENLSNIKTTSSNWGGNLSYTNKILPFSATYNQGNLNELEIQTGRLFLTRYKNFETRITKSFSSIDVNEFGYSHNDYARQDLRLPTIRNLCDNLYLNDNLFLDKEKKSSLHSHISSTHQTGNEAYNRIQIMENASFQLNRSLNLMANYNYYYNQRVFQRFNQNYVNGVLRHQLYQSLSSAISLEFNRIRHSVFSETSEKAGLDFSYNKKIPTGQLSLGYKFSWQRQERTSESVELPIYNEEHLLVDGKIELLQKSFADPNSVVVKDITGTVIYKLNFDYILIARSNYFEIQRIPGGQIANKTKVYIDYIAKMPGSYHYDVNFHLFSADVVFLNRLVEFYYNLSYQDYHNVSAVEFLTLNYFRQNLFGFKTEYKFASGGLEYETYISTVVPYRSIRYFLVLQGTFKNNFLYSLNGNMRDYYMYEDRTKQKFIDVTGKVSYSFSPQLTFNVEMGYRKQIGQRIDLDLLILRGEFNAFIRQVSFRIGVETYNREYLHERTDFLGGYVTIARTFNWNKR